MTINKSIKSIGILATDDFAMDSLKILYENNYKIKFLISRPIRKSGRGLKKKMHQVITFAYNNNIPFYTPEVLTFDFLQKTFPVKPDLIVVIAYGQILSQKIIDWTLFINLHASLLPELRGADPIRNSLLLQNKKTGVSLQKIERKMDSGAIYAKSEVEINSMDNYDLLHKKLSILGAFLLIKTLPNIMDIIPISQNTDFITYAPKLDKSTQLLESKITAKQALGRIFAWSNKPGAYLTNKLPKISILSAEIISDINANKNKAGEKFIFNKFPAWKCSDCAIKILVLRPEGKNNMSGLDFLNGNKWS